MLVQRGFQFDTHLPMSNFMGFWSLGEKKKLGGGGVTLFRDVNHEGLGTVLAPAAH